jgi:hypothetical protein
MCWSAPCCGGRQRGACRGWHACVSMPVCKHACHVMQSQCGRGGVVFCSDSAGGDRCPDMPMSMGTDPNNSSTYVHLLNLSVRRCMRAHAIYSLLPCLFEVYVAQPQELRSAVPSDCAWLVLVCTCMFQFDAAPHGNVHRQCTPQVRS